MENNFGSSWTEKKLIFLSNILMRISMNNQKFHLTYFDGFAGSGDIKIGNNMNTKLLEALPKYRKYCYSTEFRSVLFCRKRYY
jgi:hypothetical protein